MTLITNQPIGRKSLKTNDIYNAGWFFLISHFFLIVFTCPSYKIGIVYRIQGSASSISSAT